MCYLNIWIYLIYSIWTLTCCIDSSLIWHQIRFVSDSVSQFINFIKIPKLNICFSFQLLTPITLLPRKKIILKLYRCQFPTLCSNNTVFKKNVTFCPGVCNISPRGLGRNVTFTSIFRMLSIHLKSAFFSVISISEIEKKTNSHVSVVHYLILMNIIWKQTKNKKM